MCPARIAPDANHFRHAHSSRSATTGWSAGYCQSARHRWHRREIAPTKSSLITAASRLQLADGSSDRGAVQRISGTAQTLRVTSSRLAIPALFREPQRLFSVHVGQPSIGGCNGLRHVPAHPNQPAERMNGWPTLRRIRSFPGGVPPAGRRLFSAHASAWKLTPSVAPTEPHCSLSCP
jgi:hypothetical protein